MLDKPNVYMSRRLFTTGGDNGIVYVIDAQTEETVLKLSIAAAEELSESLALRAIWAREDRK